MTEPSFQDASVSPPRATLDLEEAFTRYQSELLGTLYYLVGNVDDARDALQETFIKCWNHRQEVPHIVNLKAWIFRIALNTGRDLRQTAWRRKRKSLPEDEAMVIPQRETPADQLEKQEQNDLLQRAIHQLRPEEQEVFLLRQNGEMTYEEIAEAIGVPTGTVKTRMRLALSRVREALADW